MEVEYVYMHLDGQTRIPLEIIATIHCAYDLIKFWNMSVSLPFSAS